MFYQKLPATGPEADEAEPAVVAKPRKGTSGPLENHFPKSSRVATWPAMKTGRKFQNGEMTCL